MSLPKRLLACFNKSARLSSTSGEYTLPVGLWGELITMPLVLGVSASSIAFKSKLKLFSFTLTLTGIPPLSVIMPS